MAPLFKNLGSSPVTCVRIQIRWPKKHKFKKKPVWDYTHAWSAELKF